MRYDLDSIERSLRFASVEGPFHFYGRGPSDRRRFRVRLHDEILNLNAREAWLVALALADGRRNGLKVAADPTAQGLQEQT